MAAVITSDQPEECEDNACAGCPWCDVQPDTAPTVEPPDFALLLAAGPRVRARGVGSRVSPRAPGEPRRSSRPCEPGCSGWDVFEIGAGEWEIQQCDECWQGVADAPGDEHYQGHPTCQAKLEATEEAHRRAVEEERATVCSVQE